MPRTGTAPLRRKLYLLLEGGDPWKAPKNGLQAMIEVYDNSLGGMHVCLENYGIILSKRLEKNYAGDKAGL